ncbi:MAG: DUF4091 domain-containing protein [Clostridia bacterium]|nr:DUF4091 domain-containing protein [Clostridia bacterium]
MIRTKITSSLEKSFIDANIDEYKRLDKISALLGERLSLQLLYTYEDDSERFSRLEVRPVFEGALASYVKLHNVGYVPVINPVQYDSCDDNYISKRPGLYPDVLTPLSSHESIFIHRGTLDSLWIEINIPEDGKDIIGDGCLKVSLVRTDNGAVVAEETVDITVIGATLPAQRLIFTQWLYADCIADVHGVEMFSERHFELIARYIEVAVRNGINMILTPVFTPPLDTEVGGERPTCQLVEVYKSERGYRFGYKLLDRWLDMCNSLGVKYFEISHLFTQWGATHAPKIMAHTDGGYKRIFGWDTDAHGSEYARFLKSFLRSFIKHMKRRGEDGRIYFHISDEPSASQLQDYKRSKRIVAGILKDYPIIDALSSFDFYKAGVAKRPIPASNHIEPFLEAKVPDLWTYYCCTQSKDVSNRFIAMPSCRTRAIGMQMYKYGICGFLHWGYNFYYNRYSLNLINPYLDTTGEKWVPAGDTHSVYPAPNGCLESIRLLVFFEAITDMRAMELCESLLGKERVVKEIEDALGRTVVFSECPRTPSEIHAVRERINALVAEGCK